MKFKDLKIDDVFVKSGDSKQYVKVKEQRITCCKVKLNCKTVEGNSTAVFKPLDEVTKIENK